MFANGFGCRIQTFIFTFAYAIYNTGVIFKNFRKNFFVETTGLEPKFLPATGLGTLFLTFSLVQGECKHKQPHTNTQTDTQMN